MRVHDVEFTRAQRGWNCDIVFTVTTTRQFTDETHRVADGCWGHTLFSVFVAWWRARRAMKRLVREIQARPGERSAIGWAE